MKVIVWGCGEYGHRIIPQLAQMNSIEVLGYTDSDQSLWGKKIGIFNIFPPNEIRKLDIEQIIIAVNDPIHCQSIRKEIEMLGIDKKLISNAFTDKEYFDLLLDQRIGFIRGFSQWIHINEISGDVAECGVFRGDSAKYLNMYFPDRKLYLCDTFEGFAQEDLQDEIEHSSEDFAVGRFSDRAFFGGTTVDLVMSKMPNPNNVFIKKGYFPNTMIDIDSSFAFVNLDMDLYIPMLEGLKYFWGKMSEGGCILLHDYFSAEFKRVKQAVSDFEKQLGEKITKVPVGDDCSLALIR